MGLSTISTGHAERPDDCGATLPASALAGAGHDGRSERDARRERFRALARQVGAMSDDARAELAARFPVVTVEGRALSIHNACLVASQCPNATLVGGFRQWIRAGRCVRKGQHGMVIWIPKAKAKPEAGAVSDSERPGFIMGTVFDVAQTDEIGGAS